MLTRYRTMSYSMGVRYWTGRRCERDRKGAEMRRKWMVGDRAIYARAARCTVLYVEHGTAVVRFDNGREAEVSTSELRRG